MIAERRLVTPRLLTALVLLLMLAACSPAQLDTAGPRAWIDAPMEGSIHPIGHVQVIAHAADPDGIEQIEFRLGDQLHDVSSPDSPGAAFTKVEWDWNADQPGVYLLRVRAQASGGEWSEFDDSVITIAGQEPASPTPTPSDTITPTSTSTATMTASPSPTSTHTPTLTPTNTLEPGSIGAPTLSNHEVRYSGSCTPNQVTWQDQASHPSGVASLFLFHRVRDGDTGNMTDWSPGRSMSPAGGESYWLTMTGDQIASSVSYSGQQGTVQYQFVMHPNLGDTLRSPVYNDLTLKKCGIIIIPPPILPTITPSPVVR